MWLPSSRRRSASRRMAPAASASIGTRRARQSRARFLEGSPARLAPRFRGGLEFMVGGKPTLVLGGPRPETLAVAAAIVDFVQIGTPSHLFASQIVRHRVERSLAIHPDLITLFKVHQRAGLLLRERIDRHPGIIPHFTKLDECGIIRPGDGCPAPRWGLAEPSDDREHPRPQDPALQAHRARGGWRGGDHRPGGAPLRRGAPLIRSM